MTEMTTEVTVNGANVRTEKQGEQHRVTVDGYSGPWSSVHRVATIDVDGIHYRTFDGYLAWIKLPLPEWMHR